MKKSDIQARMDAIDVRLKEFPALAEKEQRKLTAEEEKEKNDLVRYVNLFGYNPKYGIDGKPIGSVTYKPQPYDSPKPLYEM